METVAMTGTAFRRSLTEALNRVHDGDHIEVTHYNRTTGVMVPPEWYREALRLMAAADRGE